MKRIYNKNQEYIHTNLYIFPAYFIAMVLQPPLEDWKKAGKITKEVREWSKSLIKSGAGLLEIAEAIENKIRSYGAVPAWPVNLSLNEVAAHDTALADEKKVLKDEIIKVDIGVCLNGAIGDTAYTIDLSGKYKRLVEASESALNEVVKKIKPNMPINEIGKIIHDKIVSFGFKPVFNLSGHFIEKYEVHVNPNIPNYDNGNITPLKPGAIIAIEPFATNGEGRITDTKQALIYELMSTKPIRDAIARTVLKYLEAQEKLPFCERGIVRGLGMDIQKVRYALLKLAANKNIHPHNPLHEISGGMVSQAEHTFYIGEKEAIVLT